LSRDIVVALLAVAPAQKTTNAAAKQRSEVTTGKNAGAGARSQRGAVAPCVFASPVAGARRRLMPLTAAELQYGHFAALSRNLQP